MPPRPVPPVTGDAVFITSVQLRQRYGGRSRAWPDRMVKAGKLPPPYRLGEGWFKFWKVAELDAHDAALEASAESKPCRRKIAA